ncbi:hypothetical protein OROMI_002079 [Orobanche minor]
MHPADEKKETVTFRGVNRDEQGRTRVDKVEVPNTYNIETLKHIEKKLIDKGLHRKDRHPVDGLPRGRQPKSGHGGRYTWEGPADDMTNEMEAAPAALDERDPNYVDEEAEERILRGEGSGGVAGMVVGEIDVPKLADQGVGRVDVDPKLQANV